jgi:hypothetical protein
VRMRLWGKQGVVGWDGEGCKGSGYVVIGHAGGGRAERGNRMRYVVMGHTGAEQGVCVCGEGYTRKWACGYERRGD